MPKNPKTRNGIFPEPRFLFKLPLGKTGVQINSSPLKNAVGLPPIGESRPQKHLFCTKTTHFVPFRTTPPAQKSTRAHPFQPHFSPTVHPVSHSGRGCPPLASLAPCPSWFAFREPMAVYVVAGWPPCALRSVARWHPLRSFRACSLYSPFCVLRWVGSSTH